MAVADGGEPAAKKRSDLPVRVASAVVMVAVAGTAFWLGGWFLGGFVAAIGFGIFVEWCLLVRAFERRQWARGLWVAAGVGYIGLACDAALQWMLVPMLLLFVVASVVAVDVGAYFAGRTFGGPKIAPSISPSKTWAGLGGGIAAAIALNFACAWWEYRQDLAWWQAIEPEILRDPRLAPAIPWWPVLIGGCLTAIVAQSGDFFESWMKRRAGVKDSGRLIPGHGGLFDRADGLIAVLFVIGAFGLFANGRDTNASPRPFRGGVYHLGSAPGAMPQPDPSTQARGWGGVYAAREGAHHSGVAHPIAGPAPEDARHCAVCAVHFGPIVVMNR